MELLVMSPGHSGSLARRGAERDNRHGRGLGRGLDCGGDAGRTAGWGRAHGSLVMRQRPSPLRWGPKQEPRDPDAFVARAQSPTKQRTQDTDEHSLIDP